MTAPLKYKRARLGCGHLIKLKPADRDEIIEKVEQGETVMMDCRFHGKRSIKSLEK